MRVRFKTGDLLQQYLAKRVNHQATGSFPFWLTKLDDQAIQLDDDEPISDVMDTLQ